MIYVSQHVPHPLVLCPLNKNTLTLEHTQNVHSFLHNPVPRIQDGLPAGHVHLQDVQGVFVQAFHTLYETLLLGQVSHGGIHLNRKQHSLACLDTDFKMIFSSHNLIQHPVSYHITNGVIRRSLPEHFLTVRLPKKTQKEYFKSPCQLWLPLNVLSGSEASRTARLRPIPEEQPVIRTTFFSIEPGSLTALICFNREKQRGCEGKTLYSHIFGYLKASST